MTARWPVARPRGRLSRPMSFPLFRRAIRHLTRILPVVALLGCLLMMGSPSPVQAADRADLEQVVAEHYDEDFLSRVGDYHRVRLILFFVQTALTLLVIGLAVTGPLEAWSRGMLEVVGGRAWLARLGFLTVMYLGFSLLRLPFSLIRFFHAQNYGLRNDSWTSFLLDWVKGLGIGWLMVAVVGLLVLGLFATLPRWWWVLSGFAVAILTVGYVTLAPLVIDPLFYTFERMEDAEFEADLLGLGKRGGVNASEILVADASRRTRAVNAYFTGFGRTQRIVLYDTLVDKFPTEEVTMILAHEVGHWKHRHIHKGLALGIAGVFLGLLVAHLLMGSLVNSGVQGLTGRGDPGLVVFAYGLYIVMMLVAMVPSNWISRQMESQADRASLELTGDPDTFIRTETRLARENLSNVLPPAWIEFALYTHPSNARRILMAKEFKP